MAEEAENLTIRLLQEMRSDIRGIRSDIDGIRSEVREMRNDLTNRIDGNTLILNMLAGVVHDHEQRITTMEGSAER